MTEFKNEIKNNLKEVNEKIINKLSLQEEKDKSITLKDVDLLFKVARMISLTIELIDEETKCQNL